MKQQALVFGVMMCLASPAFAAPVCNETDPGIACGTNAVANDVSNVAIGNEAELVTAPLPDGSTFIPTNATAVGYYAKAAGLGSAFGANAEAGLQAAAFGQHARALGVDSVAIGRSAFAEGFEATAVGSQARATGQQATAFGRQASATGLGGVAVGYASQTSGGIAIGSYASTGPIGAVAVGFLAKATAFGAVAFGNQTVADTAYAAAFGHGADAQADSAVALGALAKVSGAGSVALGAGSEATEAGVVSFGREGSATRRLVNLTAGVADTDGVNVSQLKAIAPALGGGSTVINGVFVNPIYNLSGGTFNNVGDALTYLDNRITNVAMTPGPQGPQGPQGPAGQNGQNGTGSSDGGAACGEAVCYDDASRRSVTLNSGGAATQLRNVAAGVAPSDGVNVSQLQAGIDQAINTSNAYTDKRISELRGDVWRVDRNARGGIAAAMAISGLPQAYAPGARMAAMAASGYRGEAGLAIGISGVTDSGRWVYKLAGSGNTTGDFGMTVGAGIQW